MAAASLAGGAAVALLTHSGADSRKLLKAILAGCSAAAVLRLASVLSRAVLGLKRERFPLEEWAEQYEEDAVDADIAIFDAHHHLWEPTKHDKGWPVSKRMINFLYMFKPRVIHSMAGSPEACSAFGVRLPFLKPYMGAELTNDIRGRDGQGHKVVGTCYLECGWSTPGAEEHMRPAKEADMAIAVNKEFPMLCNAIVAHADLRLGKAVEPLLAYYKQRPLVKGIRHSLAWSDDDALKFARGACDKDTGFDAKFREGFALLAKYGLSFDCWLFHQQVDALTSLAQAFPDTTIICDHMGFPLGMGGYNMEETFPVWQASMSKLSQCKNTYCKIGGFGMRFPGFGFDERSKPPSSDELAEAWQPFVKTCVDLWGVDRCLMESNFPMDKISCSYTVLFNALKKTVRHLSREDRRKLFEHNAKRVYRVDSDSAKAAL